MIGRTARPERRPGTDETPSAVARAWSRAVTAVLLAAGVCAFAPRGSQTLAYLAEEAPVVAVGRVRQSVTPSPAGRSFRIDVETTLKGKVQGGALVLWVPSTEEGIALAPGQRVIFFLSHVPDRPIFRAAGATGKGLWRIAGDEAGVVDPALIGPVRDLLAALGGGGGDQAVIAVLVRQVEDGRERVREDAAADLERRCPRGCVVDAPSRDRLRVLAARAPKGSAYRQSLLRAAGVPSDAPSDAGGSP